MRIIGLFLLLILSYFFNPIEPIVESSPNPDFSTFEDFEQLENIDASTFYSEELEINV